MERVDLCKANPCNAWQYIQSGCMQICYQALNAYLCMAVQSGCMKVCYEANLNESLC